MPFGKHRGRTIGELAETAAGRGYLEWVVANFDDGGALTAARIVLRQNRSVSPAMGGSR
jgi:hypothetical protein